MKALIVVDMQYDFLTGSLAVPGAQTIVGPIQDYIRHRCSFPNNEETLILFTACQHPKNHCSFHEFGGLWPPHCIEGSYGAEIQFGLNALRLLMKYPMFGKGRDAKKEEYSGFESKAMCDYLTKNRVSEVEICGLAREYCVEATYDAAKKLGYRAKVLESLTRAVDPHKNIEARALPL